ncbi:alcohol dehydrogenase [Entophlyctis helioformis]|nr:alcohol dehydrogenase [Entophlyctis helioformis]
MKAVIVSKPKGPFELVERPIPVPGPGQVVLKTKACGICHGDKIIKDGEWPLPYPRVPGHEVIGTVHAAAADVRAPLNVVGKLFGVGWFGGNCGTCPACARGDLGQCELHIMTGINHDGGLAEYLVVRASALVEIPDGMDAAETAPLLCAGLTVFGSLRESGVAPGAFVGVQGMGGLGSLGISLARSMGLRVVAISTSASKRDLCMSLGAEAFVDTSAGDTVATKISDATGGHGLDVLLATAPSAAAAEALLPALAFRGTVAVVAALDRPLSINSGLLLMKNLRVIGHTAGAAAQNKECVAFAKAFGIKPLVERFPLNRVEEAYDRMVTSKARFRSVIVFE